MDRKLSKIAITGLITLGACHCSQAQTPRDWGSPSPSTPAAWQFHLPAVNQPHPARAGVDWSRMAPSQTSGPQLMGPSDFRSPNQANAPQRAGAAVAGPHTTFGQRLSWDSVPGGAPTAVNPRSRATLDPTTVHGSDGVHVASLPWNRPAQPTPATVSPALIDSIDDVFDPQPISSQAIFPAKVTAAPAWDAPAAKMPPAVAVTPERGAVSYGLSDGVTTPYAASRTADGLIGPADPALSSAVARPYSPEPNLASERTRAGDASQSERLSFGLIESYASQAAEPADFLIPAAEQLIAPEQWESEASRANGSSTDGSVFAQRQSASAEAEMEVTSLMPMSLTGEESPSDRLAALADAASMGKESETSGYVLQDIRGNVERVVPTSTLVPIDVLPLNRLANPQLSATTRLTTAEMTGPLSNAGALFANLNIENDFRQMAFVPTPTVRGDMDASGYGPQWMAHSYAWVTPTFFHQPLYFEQENLERYGIGHARYLQPTLSAAHFFTSIGLMPYKLTTQHPCEKVYTLGHNRPGDCVPHQGRSLLGQSYPFEARRYFDSYSSYRK